MANYIVKNPNEPASYKQTNSLKFHTKYRWTRNTGRTDESGKAVWEPLITKGEASRLIDMKQNGASPAEIMKFHPLGDKAEPMAGVESSRKTVKLPDNVDFATAEALINAIADNATIIAVPNGLTAERAAEVLTADSEKRAIVLDGATLDQVAVIAVPAGTRDKAEAALLTAEVKHVILTAAVAA